MHSSESDAVRGPFANRLPSAALGTVILVAVIVSLVSARTLPFLLGIVFIALLTSAALSGHLRHGLARCDVLTGALSAFALWAAATAFWAVSPTLVLAKSGLTLFIMLATLVMYRLIRREGTMNALHLADGVWMGLSIGLTYFLIELLSDQSIKMWVYNTIGLGPESIKPLRHFKWEDGRIIAISPVDLTRNTAPISLLMWPAAVTAFATAPRSLRTPISLGLLVLAIVVIFLSTHETSKLAVVIGLFGYAFARISHTWTYRLMAVGWVACCLLVLPAAMLAHKADLHNASWLQRSAQHRIIIWNHTAEQVLQHDPLIGIGTNMTYILGPRMRATTNNAEGEKIERTLSRHAHNVFLQTWFELGAVGAALLAVAGVAVLGAVRSIDRRVRAPAFAMFASASVMGLASYGMWQVWFMAMFAFSVVMFAIAHRIVCGPDIETTPGGSTRL